MIVTREKQKCLSKGIARIGLLAKNKGYRRISN